ALANAGVSFQDVSWDILFKNNVVIGVALGLFVGKLLGVSLVSLLLVKLRIAAFPEGMDLRNLLGISLLASVGFTMSLFIASLAFSNPENIMQAKIGIFTASIIGGILGFVTLNKK
ncbi:MAG: Na+/H+ antiporter NhaA, partial [Massilibacteroides sp.]|nr:Na+/H+ antiporter NhaA [Massilibacteroides sp.]